MPVSLEICSRVRCTILFAIYAMKRTAFLGAIRRSPAYGYSTLRILRGFQLIPRQLQE